MNLAWWMGRCVRRLTAPVRLPRGWPVPVDRVNVLSGPLSFPRVPPTFMTADEYASWLRFADESAEAVGRRALAEAARGQLVCSRPELQAVLKDAMNEASARVRANAAEAQCRQAMGALWYLGR